MFSNFRALPPPTPTPTPTHAACAHLQGNALAKHCALSHSQLPIIVHPIDLCAECFHHEPLVGLLLLLQAAVKTLMGALKDETVLKVVLNASSVLQVRQSSSG